MAHRTELDPDAMRPVIARNLTRFGRRLRVAGINVGSGSIIELFDALSVVGMGRKDDVYAASKALLVQRPDQIATFDREFVRFWQDLLSPLPPLYSKPTGKDAETPAERPEQQAGDDSRKPEPSEDAADDDNATSLAVSSSDVDSDETEEQDVLPEDVLVYSAGEALRKKDFGQFTPDEIAIARRAMEKMHWRIGTRKTRRLKRAPNGDMIDFRSMLRTSMRQGGVPLELRYKERKERMRPLVLICDISGSMDRYSRILLQFVHTLESGLDNVEVFVFGTRLTRITRELRKRNVDRALDDVTAAVDDWSGGTRIGESIREFNFRWSRRVLRSGATVILISDGWDRGDPQLLGAEMARLQRACRRLIWLNPLLGATGYQPLTQGIKAALPYVDHFMPVHNLQSLEALAELLGSVDDSPPLRRQQGADASRHR